MKLALIVSLLVMSLALNAQMLQGKGVRVADGDIVEGRAFNSTLGVEKG